MINKTGDFGSKEGSGRPMSIRTKENLEVEEKMILNQEHQPGTHSAPAQIAREVILIVDYHPDQDLDFRPLRKASSKNLLIQTLKSGWFVKEN